MPGEWERLASHEGGTVFALSTAAMDRDGRNTLFAATAAGLYHSHDAGQNWSRAADTPLPLIVAVTPSERYADNGTVFAATQTGFYRSTDAGQTWRQTLSDCRVFAIASVSGTDALDRLFIGTERDGILRSDDGMTWNGANPGLLDRTVLALAFSPDAARDQTGFAATASGLYRTRNGGKSWRAGELPLDEIEVQCLAISPDFATDRLVLAGTETNGMWRSDDGGTTWDMVPGVPETGISAIAFSTVYAKSRLIAAATPNGVMLSHDGGGTWRLTGETLPPVLSLAFVPDGNGESLVAGLYRDGVARLCDPRGNSPWIPARTGLGATLLTTLIASPSFDRDRTLLAAGPEAGVRMSRDGGHTWDNSGETMADAVVYSIAIAPLSTGQRLVLAATGAGIYRSSDDGVTWEAPTAGERSPCHIVVAAAPDDAHGSAFAATLGGELIASGDNGVTWRTLDVPFGGATIVTIACSPDFANDQTLYAGTTRSARPGGPDTVTLWQSTDGGARWMHWFEERGYGHAISVVLSPSGNRSVSADGPLVGFAGQVLRPRRGAWQSRGAARFPLWSGPTLSTSNDLPATINALGASPHYSVDGMVFAATSAGVYRSRTHGQSFEWWSESLVPVPVLSLATTVEIDHGQSRVVVFALSADGAIWRRTGDD